MTPKQRAAAEAAEQLRRHYDGVLSTISVDEPGYPFGSVMPYALDRTGAPIIQVATIAQHTKNIKADPRVSLMVFERHADDLQTTARLTLIADAEKTTDEDAIRRYFRFFPEAESYEQTHDFGFYRLNVRRCRYIGGFGEIYWLDTDRVIGANAFSAEQETGMVTHMNEDHVDAMSDYLRMLGVTPNNPTMAGADAHGINIKNGAQVVRLPFGTPCEKAGDVRKELAVLARQARAILGDAAETAAAH
jgi:hypothetical protein